MFLRSTKGGGTGQLDFLSKIVIEVTGLGTYLSARSLCVEWLGLGFIAISTVFESCDGVFVDVHSLAVRHGGMVDERKRGAETWLKDTHTC